MVLLASALVNRDVSPIFRVVLALRLVLECGKSYGAVVYVVCSAQAVLLGRGSESSIYRPRYSVPARSTLSFVVLTAGSRGDVQPFIGLALELKRRKHRCMICSMAKYKKLVESHGIQFKSCGIDDIRNDDSVWRNATHVSQVSVWRIAVAM